MVTNRNVHADAGAGVALACPHRQAARGVRIQRGQDHLAGGGQVLGRAGTDGGDPQRRIDYRCYNRMITALRAPTERGNALLGRWRALDRVTLCPQRISALAAALVLTSLDRGIR